MRCNEREYNRNGEYGLKSEHEERRGEEGKDPVSGDVTPGGFVCKTQDLFALSSTGDTTEESQIGACQ